MVRRPYNPVLILAALLVWGGLAHAQTPRVPLDNVAVHEALQYLHQMEAETIEEQIAICEIPAPPFMEARRAEDYRTRLAAVGLQNVRIDAEGNVLAERRGEPGAGVVILSGHLDTVFPDGTDVRVRREGAILRAPGILDDCRGLAVVIAVARALEVAELRTHSTILFVGTVGEEGEGNLRGVRHLFESDLRDQVNYFISVDAAGAAIYKDAVGSYRYTVTYRGPGGHSFGAFGTPNPIHALGRAISRISDFQVPADPKVTFNVGTLAGGTSVNSIPFEASMQVDMRSVDPAALDALDARFRAAVEEALEEENTRWGAPNSLTVEVDRWGLRPAARQDESSPAVQTAIRAAEALGLTPRLVEGSTDANIPLSLGIPSVTMGGGGSGGGAHSLDEWFDTTDSHLGTQWVLLTTLMLAGLR